MKRIWIDLDNSPHIPFFVPIIKRLKKEGYSLLVTSKQSYQVVELADFHNLNHTLIGRHYGKFKILKVIGVFIRAFQLLWVIIKFKPNIALAHGSRSLVVVANILRITSVIIMDYEYGKSLPFFKVDYWVLPDILSSERFICRKEILKYDGIKEDVYIPNFKSDPGILQEIQLDMKKVIVTVRPPATAAHYHTEKSDTLFAQTMSYLLDKENVQIVLLPRSKEQKNDMFERYGNTNKVIIPKKAVNGLNLIWHSDLVVSGGGTIIREAAALEVPAYSIFGGQMGAVDKYLERKQKLTILDSQDEITNKIRLEKRNLTIHLENQFNPTLNQIINFIKQIIGNS